MKKYRLSEESRTVQTGGPGAKESRVVRQIIALRDFADVTAGTPGGWLENEQSLSHDGDYAVAVVVIEASPTEASP